MRGGVGVGDANWQCGVAFAISASSRTPKEGTLSSHSLWVGGNVWNFKEQPMGAPFPESAACSLDEADHSPAPEGKWHPRL